jgi:hypothetical protein
MQMDANGWRGSLCLVDNAKMAIGSCKTVAA